MFQLKEYFSRLRFFKAFLPTSDCEKTSQSVQQIYLKTCKKNRKEVFLSMQHIQGISRNQLQVSSLEDTISADNPVRFIDAFVGTIDLEKLGFTPRVLKAEGRPSFDTQVFLKIYLYGYLNGIRSSRKLERECFRNLKMPMLQNGQLAYDSNF